MVPGAMPLVFLPTDELRGQRAAFLGEVIRLGLPISRILRDGLTMYDNGYTVWEGVSRLTEPTMQPISSRLCVLFYQLCLEFRDGSGFGTSDAAYSISKLGLWYDGEAFIPQHLMLHFISPTFGSELKNVRRCTVSYSFYPDPRDLLLACLRSASFSQGAMQLPRVVFLLEEHAMMDVEGNM